MEINLHRKKLINNLANYVSENFIEGHRVNLIKIVEYEELPVYFDHYENTFDGMLVYMDSMFHIHINIDKGNIINSKRGRFTLAHELGHYLIDEHRIALKYGMISSHQSKNGLLNKDLIELEADYFASCVLMPEALFKDSCARRKFSFTLIQELSNIFQVSIMAVILRFIEVGSREFLVVISKNNVIRWYAKSHDFQKVSFKFKINSILPKGSISALFKSNSDLLTEIEIMDTDVWFINRYYSDTIYEQCYYSEINDYLITLIWFE
ncbi:MULTISPECIES: ImmA/IrrE family metallo-endopeptidase [Sphingobacterium]|uniref:ImmA/IrrE family metallo-endopeptidase n=1 Tax=Sphingobacterium TaxID=28453 RepID=UPI00257C5784|nr:MULTISPECIES: ImmA/IrrE family metallo-endopeptidase [Sphingobacterium]